MLALLGSNEKTEDFFEFHFERSHFHIPYSTRTDRKQWLRLYRRFLPHHDIDTLLSYNASAFTKESLALHCDLDLVRPKEKGDEVVDTLLKGAKDIHAVDLDSVHRAFRDGFGVRVYVMEMRSAVVADLVERLRAFWVVSVSADMEFIPGSAMKTQVRILAEDSFFVVMEGAVAIVLYEDFFPFPTQKHIRDESIVENAKEGLGGIEGKPVEVREGDVLYVPRGCGIEIRGTGKVNLYTVFKVKTEESILADGIVGTMKSVKDSVLDNPLYKRLESRGGVEYGATWVDVFESAVKIAAEFLPQLRRFLALGGGAMETIEEVGGLVGGDLLTKEVRKFSEAASKALFEGVMDILAGEEEDTIGLITSREVMAWARRVVKEGDVLKMEGWFKICVAIVARHEMHAQNAMMELQSRKFERDLMERGERLEWRDQVLERHGVKRKRERGVKRYAAGSRSVMKTNAC